MAEIVAVMAAGAIKMRILIIGFGEMGHAMQALLTKRHELIFYDVVARDGLEPVDVETEASLADVVLLCIPTEPHQKLLEKLAPHLRPGTVCQSIAKGLDSQGRTPAQIYSEVFGDTHPYALLYGPMIAEEIRAGRDGFADLWCSNDAARETLHAMYTRSRLHLRDTSDVIGISWAVVLKNVYAMAFGITDELKLGVNVRGFLAVTALHELSKIVRDKGGDPSTPLHLAGLGDLITTATSADSHHHGLGQKLARGEHSGITGEGPHTLSMVEEFSLLDTARYPLFALIRDIIADPPQARDQFMRYLDTV